MFEIHSIDYLLIKLVGIFNRALLWLYIVFIQ